LIVAFTALGISVLRSDATAPAALSLDPSKGPSIAVLPFTNASGDPDQEYFSIGLTEDIITELSRYRELAVIAHFSTADFKKNNADAGLTEIGATLRARYVLQGSVFRQGDRIRINVRLSDAIESRSVWGTTYERDLTVQDLFAIQDDLTQQVVSAIAGTYGALVRAELSALRGKPPTHLRSYDCVLRANDYLQNHTSENHALARDCLEKVVEAEPDYADGLAWLGYIYGEEYHHRRNERPDEYDALDRALELGLEAVRLDGASHVTHGNLGLTYYFRGDYERGDLESRRAIELAPNHAMWLAVVGLNYIQRENFDEGVPMVDRAIELFTPHPPGWVRMAKFLDHYAHERYEEALVEMQATVMPEDFRLPLFLAAAYGQLGRPEDAGPALEELRRIWTLPVSELRAELIERHAHSAGLTDHLLEGLTKAGLDLTS
jgi:adenylate cyclase